MKNFYINIIILLKNYPISTVWSIAIFVLSIMPKSSLQADILFFEHFDKLVHCCLYSLMTLTFTLENYKKNNVSKSFSQSIVIIFSASIYGFLIEIAQKFLTINRVFDILDVFANIFGAILGSFASLLLIKFYRKKKSSNM